MNNRCHEKFFKFTFSQRQLAKNNLVQLYWASVIPFGFLVLAVIAGMPMIPITRQGYNEFINEDIYIAWILIAGMFAALYLYGSYIEYVEWTDKVWLYSYGNRICDVDRAVFLQSYTLVDDKYYVLHCKCYKRLGVRNTMIFDKVEFERLLASLKTD